MLQSLCNTEYDQQLLDLETQRSAAFDGPEMQEYGPYTLSSLVFRNGYKNSESHWSVVKGDDGKWWRIQDLVKTEVGLTLFSLSGSAKLM